MKMTNRLLKYIHENNLSIQEISRATGIEETLLSEELKRPLYAEELLKLCAYLRVDPMVFWDGEEQE